MSWLLYVYLCSHEVSPSPVLNQAVYYAFVKQILFSEH